MQCGATSFSDGILQLCVGWPPIPYFLHARGTSSEIRFVSLFTPAQYPHCGRGSEILLNRISNLSHDISSCLIYLSISEKDWGAASVCETAGNKVSSDWMGRICWIGRGIIVSALRVSLYDIQATHPHVPRFAWKRNWDFHEKLWLGIDWITIGLDRTRLLPNSF